MDDVVPPPKELLYLWDWLCELQYPLSYSELESWMRLTGRHLEQWQIRAMQELDKVRSYG